MIAMAFMTTVAAGLPPHRLVVVVGRPDDPRVGRQHAALDHDSAGLQERDVVVQDITPEAALRDHPELGVSENTSFEVLLLGRDGQVKLRRTQTVAASEISALIDTMPMRQNEMKR